MRELLKLFFSFSKIGFLTFGGGYAMLPILRSEIVEKNNWLTEQELLDYYALSQCVPGVIAVNSSIFVGYKKRGVTGALFAVTGIATPALIIDIVLAGFLFKFTGNSFVNYAFNGIRVAVALLIADTVISMWKTGIHNLFGVLLFIASFIITVFSGSSPIIIIIAAMLLGVAYDRLIRSCKV